MPLLALKNATTITTHASSTATQVSLLRRASRQRGHNQGSSATSGVINIWHSTGTGEVDDYLDNGSSRYGIYRTNDLGGYVSAVGGTPSTNRRIDSSVFSGTYYSKFVDGVGALGASLDTTAVTVIRATLGTYHTDITGTYAANFRIVHMSVYNVALSTEQRELAEAFILARRGA